MGEVFGPDEEVGLLGGLVGACVIAFGMEFLSGIDGDVDCVNLDPSKGSLDSRVHGVEDVSVKLLLDPPDVVELGLIVVTLLGAEVVLLRGLLVNFLNLPKKLGRYLVEFLHSSESRLNLQIRNFLNDSTSPILLSMRFRINSISFETSSSSGVEDFARCSHIHGFFHLVLTVCSLVDSDIFESVLVPKFL